MEREGFSGVGAVATFIDSTRGEVYQLVRKRQLPHYRRGRRLLFKLSEIERYLEEQRQEVVES